MTLSPMKCGMVRAEARFHHIFPDQKCSCHADVAEAERIIVLNPAAANQTFELINTTMDFAPLSGDPRLARVFPL